MRAVLVAVAFGHAQILVTADAIDGWQVNTSLHQMRDGGVAQRVAH